jgi:hypothetical protein
LWQRSPAAGCRPRFLTARRDLPSRSRAHQPYGVSAISSDTDPIEFNRISIHLFACA